jgi:hypothetical protein
MASTMGTRDALEGTPMPRSAAAASEATEEVTKQQSLQYFDLTTSQCVTLSLLLFEHEVAVVIGIKVIDDPNASLHKLGPKHTQGAILARLARSDEFT